jgi:hypothetical protein
MSPPAWNRTPILRFSAPYSTYYTDLGTRDVFANAVQLAVCTGAMASAGETGSSGNASDFFLGCACSNRPRLRLFWLRYFLVLLSPSKQMSVQYFKPRKILVATPLKARGVLSLSGTGIFGSNTIRGMDVFLCVSSLSVALCRCSFWEALNPVQGVLPTRYNCL